MNNNIENFVKINNPSGKLEFFKVSIAIVLFQLLLSLVFLYIIGNILGLKSIIWFPFIFVIFVELPLLYLYFIQCAKRAWDITGNKNSGILMGAIVFTIIIIFMIYFPPVTILLYLILILLNGKIIKNV